MGRAKLKMELIKKDKTRNVAFKKRKEGLFRKMHEFTTLCDVKACMILYGPKQENGPPIDPDIWPKDEPDHVRGMINDYKAKKQESGNKSFGLNDFFHERKKKVEDELSKLRKKNMEAKYPTSLDEEMQKMTQGELRQFAAELGNKAEHVKAKIEILKRSPNKQRVVDTNNSLVHFGNGQLYPPPPPLPANFLSNIDQQLQYPINQNSMMYLLMNGGDQFGIGGGANFQSASFRSQVFYETASSSGARYYGQPLLPPPPLGYMVAPPELHYSAGWENRDGVSYEDVVQMKNEHE